MEDEDGEVVKTYEIPSSKPKTGGEGSTGGAVRKELNRMGTWTGITKKPGDAQKAGESSRPEMHHGESVLGRLGNWGFKGPNTEESPDKGKIPDSNGDDDDDRHIRFTIGGAGRRLTKDDFLKEIQSLDPKARAAIVDGSDAPAAMKDLARKDASADSPGSSRLFTAKAPQMASGKGAAKSVGAEMARRRGAPIEEDEEMRESGSESESDRQKRRAKSVAEQGGNKASQPKVARRVSHADSTGETQAERRRREQALKGVDSVTPAQRGRERSRDEEEGEEDDGRGGGETAAERRRREAALGLDRGAGGGEDSDDDDTPRVPPPVARSRGIRFAQSPVRGEKK